MDSQRIKRLNLPSNLQMLVEYLERTNLHQTVYNLQCFKLSSTSSSHRFACGSSFPTANHSKKTTPAIISSVAQRTHSNSSISGPNVKPYVSKRERERLNQVTASTNHQFEKIDCDGSSKEVNLISEPKPEMSGIKTTDRVCRPPKQLHLNLEGHSQGVNCVRWNPSHSNLLLSASMDHMVCVWDTHKGGTCTRRLTRHTEAVKDSKWSLCGSQVLSCGYDKTARLSNLETGQEIKLFPHKNYVTCVQFHPTDPALFLAGTFKSAIQCWDTRTGNITSTYSAFFGQVQDIAFIPGGQEFISAAEVVRRNSTDKGIMVWDFRSTAILSNQIYQEAFTCTCLKVHPSGSHFVAQSNGGYIALFSTSKPYKLNKFKRYEGHKVCGYHIGCDFSPDGKIEAFTCTCLKVHPSGSHFVAQSNGGYIALFSTSKPYKLNKFKRYEGHKVCGYHIGCDFSPDGKIVSSGSADGKLFFYDHYTSRVIRTLEAHSMPCMDVAYHPTLPSCVASCGWGGQVKVWT
ncbi:WD repeat-containing protein 25 [Desmophyllum pertusum]|uniref:WD repeat-containing protein 25 n=1 Tax=Desmophyllum pertusum TaxID=174260 RepID=A0A9W9YM86_9CNID|nr:WD repeat-containing protein 25 [Desmophyllum pertusum]